MSTSARQYLEHTNGSQEEILKFIYDEYKVLEVLAWEFTQLNSAMGDAPSQLKTADTPNGASLRPDKVELLLNPQSDRLFSAIPEWWRSGGRVMVSDGSDGRVESQGGGVVLTWL
ncbi:hypothetical protein Bca52824_074597 [Brassica carinata]|uniref:Uncharacterized protein n=1 Tax=Brassica carinata TaxID=52824 RepID=A0A8X7PRC6_BRACI|nr:hypothetical protein Bca52824_074597 [Brassica carinata]